MSFGKDLITLLDYTQDRKEQDDFFSHLQENCGLSDEGIEEMKECEDEDSEDWKACCMQICPGHVYAICWRLRREIKL